MWKLWRDRVNRRFPTLALLWIVFVIFMIPAWMRDPELTPLRAIPYWLVVLSLFQPSVDFEQRLFFSLPLSRHRRLDWVWLRRVATLPLFCASAALVSNALIVAIVGDEAHRVEPWIIAGVSVILAACAALIVRAIRSVDAFLYTLFHGEALPPRPAQVAEYTLEAIFALAAGGTLLRTAPLNVQHLDAISAVALALGAILFAISFLQRRREEETGPPRPPNALFARLARRRMARTRPARRGSPRRAPLLPPRLMFYEGFVVMPAVLCLAFAAYYSYLLTRDQFAVPADHGRSAAAFLFMPMAVQAAPLPSLRALRQLPMKRFRLSLWLAQRYAARGLLIALGLAELLTMSWAPPTHVAVAFIASFAGIMGVGGLRALNGPDYRLDSFRGILHTLGTVGLLGATVACLLFPGQHPLAQAFAATAVLAFGSWLFYCAVARSSHAYRRASTLDASVEEG